MIRVCVTKVGRAPFASCPEIPQAKKATSEESAAVSNAMQTEQIHLCKAMAISRGKAENKASNERRAGNDEKQE
jgi:hypothetical protein